MEEITNIFNCLKAMFLGRHLQDCWRLLTFLALALKELEEREISKKEFEELYWQEIKELNQSKSSSAKKLLANIKELF